MLRRLRYFLELRAAGRTGGPPPASERVWVHPSELPGSFDHAKLPPLKRSAPRRLQVAVAATASALLMTGGVLLSTPATSPPADASVGPRVVTSIAALPTSDRSGARSMLALVLLEGEHLGAATAMVLPPGDLAVTTTPIAAGTSVYGRAFGQSEMQLVVVGRDVPLGVTVLRLPRAVPITPTDPLGAALSTGGSPTAFTALAAVRGATTPVEFEFAPAYLSSQPAAMMLGRTDSELAVTLGRSLTGTIAGTIILDGHGNAVAAEVPKLGSSEFVSASFLRLLAQRLVLSHSAGHGWLQIAGSVPSGASRVTVQLVDYLGASWGKIQRYDQILSINSIQMRSMADIGTFLYTSSPGQPVSVDVVHNGRTINVTIRLAATPTTSP